jgi:hypothetical protein
MTEKIKAKQNRKSKQGQGQGGDKIDKEEKAEVQMGTEKDCLVTAITVL